MKNFITLGLLAAILSKTNAVKGGVRDDVEARGLKSHANFLQESNRNGNFLKESNRNGNWYGDWYAHLTPTSGSNCPNQAVGVVRATLDSNRRFCYRVLTVGFEPSATMMGGSNFNNMDLASNEVDSNTRSCFTLSKEQERQLHNQELHIRSESGNCVINGKLKEVQWSGNGRDGFCPSQNNCNHSGNRVTCSRNNLGNNCQYASLDCARSAGFRDGNCYDNPNDNRGGFCPNQNNCNHSGNQVTCSRNNLGNNCQYTSLDCARSAGFRNGDCYDNPNDNRGGFCPNRNHCDHSGNRVTCSRNNLGNNCQYASLDCARTAGFRNGDCSEKGSGFCPNRGHCNHSGNRVTCSRNNLGNGCNYASLDCARSAGFHDRDCN